MLSESDLCPTSSVGTRHLRNVNIFVPVGWRTASLGYQVSTNLDKTTELPRPGSVVPTGMVPPSVGKRHGATTTLQPSGIAAQKSVPGDRAVQAAPACALSTSGSWGARALTSWEKSIFGQMEMERIEILLFKTMPLRSGVAYCISSATFDTSGGNEPTNSAAVQRSMPRPGHVALFAGVLFSCLGGIPGSSSHLWFAPVSEGTGTRPDYLVNRADKKLRGNSGKIFAPKSRNCCQLKGRGCGSIRIVDSRCKFAQS